MLDVKGTPQLRAAVLAMRAADSGLRRVINDETKTVMGPVWTSAVNRLAFTAVDKAVLAKGARIKAGNPPVAVAASSSRRLKGGLVPADDWAPFEFGSGNRERYVRYRARSHKGRYYTVHRRTARQLPPRHASGWTVFAAFAETAPRVVSLWVQTIVRAYNEALHNGPADG